VTRFDVVWGDPSDPTKTVVRGDEAVLEQTNKTGNRRLEVRSGDEQGVLFVATVGPDHVLSYERDRGP